MKRYSNGRKGAWKADNKVRLGELVEPVAFIHAKKVAIEGTAVFEERVKPFIQTLAAVDEGEERLDGVIDSDSKIQTVFVIRDEGQLVTLNDFVVWGLRVYKVIGSRRERKINAFLEVVSNPYGEVGQCGFTLDLDIDVSEPGDTTFNREFNPYWTDDTPAGVEDFNYLTVDETTIVRDENGTPIQIGTHYSFLYLADGRVVVLNDHKYPLIPDLGVMIPEEGFSYVYTNNAEQTFLNDGSAIRIPRFYTNTPETGYAFVYENEGLPVLDNNGAIIQIIDLPTPQAGTSFVYTKDAQQVYTYDGRAIQIVGSYIRLSVLHGYSIVNARNGDMVYTSEGSLVTVPTNL